MGAVDTQIANAENRARAYAAETYYWVSQLQNFAFDRSSALYLPAIRNADGTVTSGLDLSGIRFPTYASPPKDATAFPVYEPPTAKLPAKPDLAPIANVTLPPKRTLPTLNLAGLFGQVAPSPNLPDFTEHEPDLAIDELVAEMDAIAAPLIADVTLPPLSPLKLGDAPDVEAPDYVPAKAPDGLPDPADYAAAFAGKYDRMLPEMQAWIDDRVSVYLARYAPGYKAFAASVQAKLSDGLAGGGVLPDRFEQAMYTRAQGRAEREFAKAGTALAEAYQKGGFMAPPGAVMGGAYLARLQSADALANQATDIYIKRTEIEAQYMQFVLAQAGGYVADVRNAVLSYTGIVLQSMQQAAAFAQTFSDKVAQSYEHLIARANLALAVMQELGRQYEIRKAAALARLEAYKVRLEAEKAKKDIEIAQIQALESQVKIQALQVERYSALIDAVTRKGDLEELKLKGYQIRADIYKARVSAQVAGFDMYKASIDGDKAKMEGELAKLTLLEDQIKIDQMNLESQTKAIEATEKANDGKIKIFQAEGDMYKLASDAALAKFTAYAEVKKLHQSIYGQELTNAIESFKADFGAKQAMMEALVKQYELSVQTAIEEARIDLTKWQVAERATEAAVDAFKGMAASSLGSLNSVVSSAIQASS